LQVFVKNYGCSANTADAQVISGCLKEAGYELASQESDAEVLIYNTCAVKGPTENRIIDDLQHAPKNKKIIVSGCLPKISYQRLKRETHFDAAVGPSVGRGIVEVVSRVLAGEKVVELGDAEEMPKLDLPTVKSNPVVSIIPINSGCLGSCAYCCVFQARGHLRSYSIQEVADRVKGDLATGSREFWITSQDTACYGRDRQTNLAELLDTLGRLEGDFRVRVGMMTPNWVVDIQPQLIDAFRCEKIFKFLHLPVQSSDDQVLKLMRRFYTAEQFRGIVEAFRESFPSLTLATDVIVGFPGETEEAFNKTLKLLEEVKPDVVNISKFFVRPNTAAAKIQEGLVPKEETKRRSSVAAELAKRISLEQNLHWVGWIGEVLVDEKGKVEGTWVGRNFAYKPVALKCSRNLLGQTIKVQVESAAQTYLRAAIVE
jgi:threonylcarbamoyladenosine tRNA methylthiotransferase CDKAL1